MNVCMVRDFFLWCSVINAGLLLFSFVMFLLCRGFIYRIHGRWFKISREQFDAIWYAVLGFYKICILLFNIVPFVAMCIVG